jgi:hypothetical protein
MGKQYLAIKNNRWLGTEQDNLHGTSKHRLVVETLSLGGICLLLTRRSKKYIRDIWYENYQKTNTWKLYTRCEEINKVIIREIFMKM